MRATSVWKQRQSWIVVVLGALLAAIATISYLGPAGDPEGHLRALPLVLVDEDQGARGPQGTVRLGEQITRNAVAASHRDGRVHWTVVSDRAAARRIMTDQDAYAALVVPGDFSRRALSLLGAAKDTQRPQLQIIERRGVGAMATSMAEKALRATAEQVSQRIGAQLADQADASSAGARKAAPVKAVEGAATQGRTAAPPVAAGPGFLALLSDPVQVTETVQQAGGPSAGATAGILPLYFAVALLISGLLPASLLTMLVDARLGYLPLEIGPRRRLSPVIRIARSSTFLAKALLGTVMGFAAGTTVAATGLWSTGIDPEAGGELLLFCGAACAAVSLVTLALFAVFGTPGQILALVLLTLAGIPLSGGPIPVEALPGALNTLGDLLPARYVVEGVRSLMFFGGSSMPARDWTVLGGYAAGALLLGLGVTHWYDRRGFHRAHEHELVPAEAAAPALP
ncbi:YhgE/Pip domain-containing protein [Streptomyces sp. NPDC001494]